jgi:hypothetical protein
MDESGRDCLRFLDLTKELREQLDRWLTVHCEKAEKPRSRLPILAVAPHEGMPFGETQLNHAGRTEVNR